jgi:hypothetical protein
MKVRTAASVVGLVNGAWMIYAGWFWGRTFFFPIPIPAGVSEIATAVNPELLGLGVILVLDSLVCFLNWTKAFYASAFLSVLGILIVVAVGPSPNGPEFVLGAFLVSVSLGMLTIALNVVAARSRTFVPEQDHPLNLPVFG